MKHGTYAGYHQHRSHGTPSCDDCKDAKKRYERARRSERSTDLAALTHPSNTAWDAGCRCDACTQSHSSRGRAYYSRPPT